MKIKLDIFDKPENNYILFRYFKVACKGIFRIKLGLAESIDMLVLVIFYNSCVSSPDKFL